MTAHPDPVRGSEGLCWGLDHAEAFAECRGDAPAVRDLLSTIMPQAGEDRRPVADDFGSVYSQFIEFMAGRAAARMLLDGEPAAPVNDLYQARELARLICTSDEAIDAFIGHCDVAARDLLMAYGDAVMALSVVLRRTLDGAETDQIIREMEARKALAVEYPRRAEWRKSELAASWFRDECNHLNAAPPSHLAQDRMV